MTGDSRTKDQGSPLELVVLKAALDLAAHLIGRLESCFREAALAGDFTCVM